VPRTKLCCRHAEHQRLWTENTHQQFGCAQAVVFPPAVLENNRLLRRSQPYTLTLRFRLFRGLQPSRYVQMSTCPIGPSRPRSEISSIWSFISSGTMDADSSPTFLGFTRSMQMQIGTTPPHSSKTKGRCPCRAQGHARFAFWFLPQAGTLQNSSNADLECLGSLRWTPSFGQKIGRPWIGRRAE
jgi:hypothetical protein